MIWLSPMFEVMGIHDPSVWYWPKNDYRLAQSAINAPRYKDVHISCIVEDGNLIVSGGEEPVSEVRIMDLAGRTIGMYQPDKNLFSVNVSTLKNQFTVVRASTSKGSKSFKIIF